MTQKSLILSIFIFSALTACVTRFPGNSVAETRLQQDALPMVTTMVAAKSKCSETPLINDTQVLTKPEPVKNFPDSYSWNELWVLSACDKLYGAPVHFLYTKGKGTDFMLKEDLIRTVTVADEQETK